MVGYLPPKVQLALRSNDQFINMRMVFIQATYAYKIPPLQSPNQKQFSFQE
jgi:hypothetical protein